MRHLVKSIAAGVVIVMLAGCAAGPASGSRGAPTTGEAVQLGVAGAPGSTIQLTHEDNAMVATLPLDAEQVWQEVRRVYAEIGVAPDRLSEYDPRARRIAISDYRAPRLADMRLSLLLRCSHSMGVPSEDSGDVRIFLSTALRPHGDGVDVITRFQGQEGQRGPLCASTGRLEQEILARILDRVGNTDR